MKEILIYDAIGADFFGDGVTATAIAAELKESEGDILVRINSPGGDVFDGAAIYNLLRGYKNGAVDIVVDGLAASAASVIAMAGRSVTMAHNSLMMIHNPWTFALGDSSEMVKTAERLDKVKDTIIATYQSRSSLDKDVISQLMDEETWLDADGAIANGLADSKDGEAMQIAASAVPWIRNQPEKVGDVLTLNVNAISSEITLKSQPSFDARIERRERFSNITKELSQ